MGERRWIVRVHWLADDQDDEDIASRLLEHLGRHSAVVNRHPVDGVWDVTISFAAPTDEAAVVEASRLVRQAVGKNVAAEVLREHID